jgi:uncharacterized protein
MATRRIFLASLAAAALPRASWADAGDPAFLAAAKLADETFALHGLSAGGDTLFSVPLPARGHAAAAHPSQPVAVVFARRPGTYALVLDAASGAIAHCLTPPANRHFNGHGAFSADGDLLFTAEQRANDSAGIIGKWETQGFRRIGEMPSHGIGPHDLRRLADGSLIVANGGIATDPTDRTKLNLATMRASLAHLSGDGALISLTEMPPEFAQNSIRHMALIPGGGVAFALQWEGDLTEIVPLVGLWRDGKMTLCDVPLGDGARMQSYAGSIAATNQLIAVTSSHGGVVQIYGMDGAFLRTFSRVDVSGVAAQGAGFMLTDGAGGITHLTVDGIAPLQIAPVAWDNHLVALHAA